MLIQADQVKIGATFWDGDKGLRKVVEREVAHGVDTVRYKLLCGRRNGQPLRVEADGMPIYGCSLKSFRAWAKEQVCFGPDALK